MCAAQRIGLVLLICWAVLSKLRAEPCRASEGLGCVVTKVGGTALGWPHRAAITSHSRQWKDNRSV
ncbi:hypothetical protein LOK49_LG07G02132 [Camellia lanceoleosa]|uniref:Uncharacterized protein n=1 Tax=Camellia lanceoleosa TaxID=1840588 RepID=A0ACC0GYX9_9ERIC|nr:hypothetical protein LOK49_LG07G02132 [Camellia lanceoleosa]